MESIGLIYNQFGIIQVLQRSPLLQTSNWPGTVFAVSYSKPALVISTIQLATDKQLYLAALPEDVETSYQPR